MDKEKKKTIDEAIREALKNAPKIEGYSVRQLAEELGEPWPTSRWHLELLEVREDYPERISIGMAMVYTLKKKKDSPDKDAPKESESKHSLEGEEMKAE